MAVAQALRAAEHHRLQKAQTAAILSLALLRQPEAVAAEVLVLHTILGQMVVLAAAVEQHSHLVLAVALATRQALLRLKEITEELAGQTPLLTELVGAQVAPEVLAAMAAIQMAAMAAPVVHQAFLVLP